MAYSSTTNEGKRRKWGLVLVVLLVALAITVAVVGAVVALKSHQQSDREEDIHAENISVRLSSTPSPTKVSTATDDVPTMSPTSVSVDTPPRSVTCTSSRAKILPLIPPSHKDNILWRPPAPEGSFARAMALSQDGRLLALGSPTTEVWTFSTIYVTGRVQVWNDLYQNLTDWQELDRSAPNVDLRARGNSLAFTEVFDPKTNTTKTRLAAAAAQSQNLLLDDANGFLAGAVPVYELQSESTGEWKVLGNTTVVGQKASESLGRMAVAMDGDRLAVATFAIHNVVRIYDYHQKGNTWIHLAELASEDDNDEFGFQLALGKNGTLLAVGAPQYGQRRGKVHIYAQEDESPNQWSLRQVLLANGTEWFGHSVSMSTDGRVLAIGSNGQVFVYQLDSDNSSTAAAIHYSLMGNTITGKEENEYFLGLSLALSSDGTRLVTGVGAHCNGKNGGGGFQVYDWEEESHWCQIGNATTCVTNYQSYEHRALVALSGDGKTIVAGPQANFTRVYYIEE